MHTAQANIIRPFWQFSYLIFAPKMQTRSRHTVKGAYWECCTCDCIQLRPVIACMRNSKLLACTSIDAPIGEPLTKHQIGFCERVSWTDTAITSDYGSINFRYTKVDAILTGITANYD